MRKITMRDFITFLKSTGKEVNLKLSTGKMSLEEWKGLLDRFGCLDSEFASCEFSIEIGK